MLADVVADSQRVIGDFVVRSLAGTAFAAVDVVRLTHLARDDLTKLESRATGGVLLVTVVSLDDLDIHAARMIPEGLPRLGHQLHRDVHGEAHAGGHQDRRDLSGLFNSSPLRGGQSRGGNDQRNGSLSTLLQDVHTTLGRREVDHDIHVFADFCGHEHVELANTGQFASVIPQLRRPRPFVGRSDFQRFVRRGECHDSLPHAAGRSVHAQFQNVCHVSSSVEVGRASAQRSVIHQSGPARWLPVKA